MNIDSDKISGVVEKVLSKLKIKPIVAIQFTSHLMLVIAISIFAYDNYNNNKHDNTISEQSQTIEDQSNKIIQLENDLKIARGEESPVPISKYPVVELSKATNEMADILSTRNWKGDSAQVAVDTCRNTVISVLLDSNLVWE